MEHVLVREAGPADAAAVARLLDQLGYPAPVGEVAQRLEALAASGADIVLVAELDGRVVGVAGVHVSTALERQGPVAKLSALVVDADARSHGIGRRLVAAVEGEARRRGCTLLFLTTAERRADAHAFYRALGFDETGRRFAKTLE